MTFTRLYHFFQSDFIVPYEICINLFLDLLSCLSYFTSLFSCQSAGSLLQQRLFRLKKQAVPRDSLHILARMLFFVKHFSRNFATFFVLFAKITRTCSASPRASLYIVYIPPERLVPLSASAANFREITGSPARLSAVRRNAGAP